MNVAIVAIGISVSEWAVKAGIVMIDTNFISEEKPR